MKSHKYRNKLEGSRKYKFKVHDALYHSGILYPRLQNADFFEDDHFSPKIQQKLSEKFNFHPYQIPNHRSSRTASHQLNTKYKFTSNQLSEQEAESRIQDLKKFSDECSKFESTTLLNIEQNSNNLENLHNRNYKSEAYLPARFVTNYEQYRKDQEVSVCETTAKDKTHWRVEKSVELIPAIYLMLPAPDPQARADALELRKQYGQIQECWESRNRRARQVTSCCQEL